MKKLRLLFGVASLLSLSSCDLVMLSERGIGQQHTRHIERGMSQEQVYSLWGRPTYRQLFEEGIEEWEYHKSELFEKRITIISFSRGRVIRTDSYSIDDEDTDPRHYPQQRRSFPRQRDDYPYYGDRRYGDERWERENEQWFDQIYRDVQRKVFTDDKVLYIRDVARRNRFTTEQSIKLLRIFYWDEEKLKVLAYLAPGLRDPRNAYRIIDQFTFSSSQQKARRLLGLPS